MIFQFFSSFLLPLNLLLLFSSSPFLSSVSLKAWKRAAKSDCEDDSASEMYYESKRDQSPQLPQGGAAAAASAAASGPSRQKKMSFKTASQATLSFLSARKRIEDGLKSWSKRRMSKRGSVDEGRSPIHTSNYSP